MSSSPSRASVDAITARDSDPNRAGDPGDRQIGIVIPAYRPDEQRLCPYIEALAEGLDPTEIRVELDVPDDPQAAERIAAAAGAVTVSVAETRRGKGRAITAGFEALSDELDVYCFLDADGSTPVESADDVLRPVLTKRADLSVGSRRHPEATVVAHQTVLRRFLGDGFARLAKIMLPVSLYDYQCGAKAISPAGWHRVRTRLYEDGFGWDLELIAMAAVAGLDIVEVPITWEDRTGTSVDLGSTVPDLLRAVLAVRHRSKAAQGNRVHARWFPPRTRALVDDLGGDAQS